MRGSLIADLVLGFALQLFQTRKDTKAAGYIKQLIAIKQSGGKVDAHLQTVADYLQGGKKPNFGDLTARIDSEVDELLERTDPE